MTHHVQLDEQRQRDKPQLDVQLDEPQLDEQRQRRQDELQLDAQQQRQQQLPLEERRRRRRFLDQQCYYCLKIGHIKANCWTRDLARRPYHQKVRTDKIKCIQCGFLHRIGECTVTTDTEIADLVVSRRQPEKDNKDDNKDDWYFTAER